MQRLEINSNKHWPWQSAGAFFAALALGCLHFSAALASIFTGLSVIVSLAAVFWRRQSSRSFNSAPLFIYTLLLFCVVQFLFVNWYGDMQGYGQKVLLRLPLIFVPFALNWELSDKHKSALLLLLALPVAWLSGAALINYFEHRVFYNQMVLESKPIPLYSNVYHIEYSLLQALLALLLVYALFLDVKSHTVKVVRYILFLCLAIIVFSIHVFAARTGILALWIGAISGGLIAVKGKKVKQAVLVVLVLAVTAIALIPSMRNRIVNTAEDAAAVVNGDDLNNKSFGQRWVAWSASWSSILKKPITGHGLHRVRKALDDEYDNKETGLRNLNQINPHNQYLESGVQSGLFAAVLLILTWLLAIARAIKNRNPLLLAVASAFAVAMMFESIFERQAGVLLVFFFLSVSSIWVSTGKESVKF